MESGIEEFEEAFKDLGRLVFWILKTLRHSSICDALHFTKIHLRCWMRVGCRLSTIRFVLTNYATTFSHYTILSRLASL